MNKTALLLNDKHFQKKRSKLFNTNVHTKEDSLLSKRVLLWAVCSTGAVVLSAPFMSHHHCQQK